MSSLHSLAYQEKFHLFGEKMRQNSQTSRKNDNFQAFDRLNGRSSSNQSPINFIYQIWLPLHPWSLIDCTCNLSGSLRQLMPEFCYGCHSGFLEPTGKQHQILLWWQIGLIYIGTDFIRLIPRMQSFSLWGQRCCIVTISLKVFAVNHTAFCCCLHSCHAGLSSQRHLKAFNLIQQPLRFPTHALVEWPGVTPGWQ